MDSREGSDGRGAARDARLDAAIVASLEFRWPWRPYQERVLSALDQHLSDRKLHVVAAPGSGKTCLGLEVFRRLAGPCVVLSPTRTIRDQWISRLADFLPEGSPQPAEWSSTTFDQPGFLTSLTYQALHTQYRESLEEDGEDEPKEGSLDKAPNRHELATVIERFRKIGIRTVILDEAHHLRKEWWVALTSLIEALPDARVVSLTGTPPYDVVGKEWQRYEELCGPIDEQISVPELVRAGTLCPHQDYVRAVKADPDSAAGALRYDQFAEQVTTELLTDEPFQAAVDLHPWLADVSTDSEAVLNDVELLSALLVYLNAVGRKVPKRFLRLLSCQQRDLPEFSREWCQTLVGHYLSTKSWPLPDELEAHRDELKKKLRAAGLLWRRELRLNSSRAISNSLKLNRAKIAACVEIHRTEKSFRGEALRQVVLTDFIRDDGKNELGAIPVFDALRLALSEEDKVGLAVLTGRISILHKTNLPHLEAIAASLDCKFDTSDLPSFDGFVKVGSSRGKSRLVSAFTRLFTEGRIRVMVGTRALLGEGWDAPAVNSLIMASYVGSFMLTNQMRGRALRTNPRNPAKASSIWHLVAVEPKTHSGWDDYRELERRFATFVGLAREAPSIEAGLARLSLPTQETANWVEAVNAESESRLLESGSLSERWAQAIQGADAGRVLPGVDAVVDPALKRTLFLNTLRHLLFTAMSGGLTVAMYVMQSARADSLRLLLILLCGAGGVGLLVALPRLLKAAWLYLRCLPIDGSLKQIARSVLTGLVHADLLTTNQRRLSVHSKELAPGQFSIAMRGGTYFESNLFADALAEVLGPIENPRYFITRTGGPWPFVRKDYHAVPTVLGTHKEKATTFLAEWRRRLGSAELTYTRSEEGRKQLLVARSRAFSTAFQKRCQRTDRWH